MASTAGMHLIKKSGVVNAFIFIVVLSRVLELKMKLRSQAIGASSAQKDPAALGYLPRMTPLTGTLIGQLRQLCFAWTAALF